MSEITSLNQAHNELMKELDALDTAIAAATLERSAVAARIEVTRDCLSRHFQLEESGGYMENVRSRSPHLDHTIDKLKGEHARLLDNVNHLLSLARSGKALDQSFRISVREFIEHVRGHERRENLLVEDSYNRDTGDKD